MLTKSCHDIDLLLWLLCSPPPGSSRLAHIPSQVASFGSLIQFKRSRKPVLAGEATNCLTCAAENDCIYSAKKIYEDDHVTKGHSAWPINSVDPEIEDCLKNNNQLAAIKKLRNRLAEDYDESTTPEEIDRRPWFGRCVYESDNDVCDDQVVTMTWEDEPFLHDEKQDMADQLRGRGAKIAIFHMTAFTEKRCERRGRIYGSKGEIEYDSSTIKVYDFSTQKTQIHHPEQRGGGHGGGDAGLAEQFIKAVDAVKNHGQPVAEAQKLHVGCTPEEIVRSHAMVFAAEEARKERRVLDWKEWWRVHVESTMG